MGITHFQAVSGIDGVYVGSKSAGETQALNSNGNLVTGVKTTLLETDGTTKACLTNGVTLVEGGTGIADLTLAAPSEGYRAIIRIDSLSSGSVVVTTASGVTFDGTNNTATFDAANEAIELIYKSATEWAIALNVGAVAFSSV